MTWWAVLLILIGVILKFAMSPPSALVGWVVSKFALHPKLDSKDVTITFNEKKLVDEEKDTLINYFNESLFLERNHIFPGNEEAFLNPDTDITPFVINVKKKNKEMNFFLYCSTDQIEVVKQWKKKVASYSLSSEPLQKFTPSNGFSA
ncbi:YfmQ family protein [Ureibacillus acetophenoni]|uniref:Uncharacterized protein YfmQ n=1 Tax=Ureibacillus acetophenoni TaxID=614649 RepID=A0A285US01_9BACL|nr:YfmQ family protein [Ureibacillus acetophenoni]SOC44168.1 uncharacterized protein YfmQ [Ureibacillus acetophenoni]